MQEIFEWLANIWQLIGEAGVQIGGATISVASILTLLLVLVGSWWAARYLERFIYKALHHSIAAGSSGAYAIGRLLRYMIWVLGSFIGLQMIGFNLSSLALLGGALGLGIGFGLQNLVHNFVSGIVLLVERTVKVGDFVDLASGVRGTVTEIGFRYTRVTTNSSVDVIVPNSEFTSQRVINWTLDTPFRRLNIPFSVAYGSDKMLVKEAALEAARVVSFTVEDEQHHSKLWFTKFGDSALEFDLVVWVGAEAVHRPGESTSRYLWAIDDALRKRGIEIPFPQRDLHVRSGRLSVRVENASVS